MNDNLYTFHKTIRGYRHIQEEIPCQDNSDSFCSEDDRFQIIAIADGHGDPACHRSQKGSELAVSMAMKCLTDFANAVLQGEIELSYPRKCRDCIGQLTNTIISKWYDAVHNDLRENEVTEEDMAEAGDYRKAYRQGKRLEHLYGTTLISALRVEKYLILIQQGDGRCDLFYNDGSVEQPIPWDQRCKGSTTTSMCDADVFGSIRSKVINLEEREVVACYIGSDGVEDSYYDNEESQLGTHRFYKGLSCKLNELGRECFDGYLEDLLPEFSRTGSADDVTVAGIVDLDRLSPFADEYKRAVDYYDYMASLNKRFEETKAKLISMSRKYGILKQRVEDAQNTLKKARENQDALLFQKQQLFEETEILSEKSDLAKNELDEYRQESQEAKEAMGVKYECIASVIQRFADEISTGIAMKEAAYSELLVQIQKINTQLRELEEKIVAGEQNIKRLTDDYEEEKTAFEEYDTKYRELDSEQQKLLNEIQTI